MIRVCHGSRAELRPRPAGRRGWRAVLLLPFLVAISGCPPTPQGDEHFVPRPDNLQEDRDFISPPLLELPIYACAQTVVVKGFIPGARIDVFADADPTPIGSVQSWLTSGQLVEVSVPFVVGQEITARQAFNAATSAPSNQVQVTSHTEDYPDGLPTPHISPAPCYECGRAVGVVDAVPGAWVKIYSEKARVGGGFDPPVQIGQTVGGSYAVLNAAMERDARIHAESGLCTDVSPPSTPRIVQPEPAVVPAPTLDPIHEGVEIVVVRGPAGTNPVNGATLEVLSDPGAVHVGGQPTPGGAGQQVRINPAASTANTYKATQKLCGASPPSQSEPVVPCSELPPPTIKPPLPGDTRIEVTDYVPGARILVFADGQEIGDGGGPVVVLSRPLAEAETVVVLQRIGTCDSPRVYQVVVTCNLGGGDEACSSDWPAYRHSPLRNGTQSVMSALADPYEVMKLGIQWRFPRTGSIGGFARSSPVIYKGRVFVASSDGHVYALDAASGVEIWRYPRATQAPLTSQYENCSFPGHCVNGSGRGIASSPTIATIGEQGDAVIFAAPDQSIGNHLGSGRLFALRFSDGSEIWKSPELARLTGVTYGSTSELHEQFGYSSPLILGDRVYVGIADHGDNPIQKGRIVAVNLGDGMPVAGFSFESTGTRGGGIWSSLAGGLSGTGLYATTGNVRCWNPGTCQPEPSPNHGLALLRINPGSGAIVWKLQPVPYEMDGDPDWATGAQLLTATCGEVALSTMKDGWAYAANATSGTAPAATVRWQFPATGVPFTPADGTVHGDSRYLIPGAAWNDVFLTQAGGEEVATDVRAGFGRLHALSVCGGDRVRWIADVPGAILGADYQLGPPSVTRGIVFIGTAAGNVVALADPTVWPLSIQRCSNPAVTTADCVANGYRLVPVPKVLRDLSLREGPILTEPAIAGGRVYIATGGGVVFMLEPVP